MVSSHLLNFYEDNHGLNIEEDETPIVIIDEIIHGVKGLLHAHRRMKTLLLVYRLCSCGMCMTYDDLKYHYSLLAFAAHMTLSKRMSKYFK